MPNLKSLEKEISSIHYKKGLELFEKQKVREIDEEGSGNFVAFVDDGKISHDVQVQVNTKTFDVLAHSCDCGDPTPFCQHKVAVALQIAKKGTKTSSAISKKLKVKKKSKAEELLDTVSEIDLKAWLLEELEANKSLHFKFFYRFEQREAEVDVNAVLAKTHEIVKAVLGKSKHLDLNRLVAILALWKPYHEEVIQSLLSKVHLPDECLTLVAMINAIGVYKHRLNTTSNKLDKYQDALTEKIIERIYAQNLEQKVATITNLIKAFEYDGVLNFNLPYHGLIASETVPEPQQTTLVQLYVAVVLPKRHYLEPRSLIGLFEQFQKMDKFAVGYGLFSPLYGQDDYNLSVIDELLKVNRLVEALNYTGRCINNNSYEEYSMPYFQKMVTIHNKMLQPVEALHYRILLLSLTLDIEELRSIFQEQLQDSTRRILIARINAKISGRTNDLRVIQFKMEYFTILDKPEKILGCLEDDFDWSTMDRYLQPVFAKHQQKSIDSIAHIFHRGSFYVANSDYFKALLATINRSTLRAYANRMKFLSVASPYYKVLLDHVKT